jgi:hypothetical protein
MLGMGKCEGEITQTNDGQIRIMTEIKNLNDRVFVRSMHKNAHCIRIDNWFAVYYPSKNKRVWLGISKNSRADAWAKAVKSFHIMMLEKLEL